MTEAVYVLCAVTSVACALLLLRGFRTTRTRLLFWSSLCFAGLAVHNLLLLIDLFVVPDVDLSLWRNAVALASMTMLIFGLVRESR
jgi:hypothetical protein